MGRVSKLDGSKRVLDPIYSTHETLHGLVTISREHTTTKSRGLVLVIIDNSVDEIPGPEIYINSLAERGFGLFSPRLVHNEVYIQPWVMKTSTGLYYSIPTIVFASEASVTISLYVTIIAAAVAGVAMGINIFRAAYISTIHLIPLFVHHTLVECLGDTGLPLRSNDRSRSCSRNLLSCDAKPFVFLSHDSLCLSMLILEAV